MRKTKKPDFIIVGASRCGTTALYEYLKAHPDIYMPFYKEPHYFATDFNAPNPWAKKFKIKKNYLELFSSAKKEKRIGEASSMYLYSKEAAKNIFKFNPKMKIIIMLRNPADQMYSLYYQLKYGGAETAKSFEQALSFEKERKKGKNIPKNSLIIRDLYNYRGMSSYYPQVKRFFKNFKKDQIKVLIFDDFIKDTHRAYKEVLRFLEVDENFKPDFKIINPNMKISNQRLRSILSELAFRQNLLNNKFMLKLLPLYKKIENLLHKEAKRPSMKKDTRLKLTKEYKPMIKKLEKLISRDLSSWYG